MRKSLGLLAAVTLLATASYAQKLGCGTTDKHRTPPKDAVRISGLDTTKGRGLADNYYLWANGATLKVKFLSGSKMLQERVKNLAKVWESHANLKFDFVGPDDEADIRVLLGTGEGHYSYIGTIANLIPGEEHTMQLDTIDLGTNLNAWQRTTQHEFGHAIGLLHEHSSPVSGIKWDKEKMYAHYAKMGWSREDVDQQVFASYAVSYANGTTYDNKSIMHYPILAWQTTDGYAVPWNTNISAGDRNIIGMLYPKTGTRANEVPTYSFKNFKALNTVKNDSKGGVSFFPTFDLKATGASGKLYFCVLFYDKDGYGIEDDNGNYAYNQTVAAVRIQNMLKGDVITANQNGKKDFELFIPDSEIPLKEGQHKLMLEFRVVQFTPGDDDGIPEVKYIYQSDIYKLNYTKKPEAAQSKKAPAPKKKG